MAVGVVLLGVGVHARKLKARAGAKDGLDSLDLSSLNLGSIICTVSR